MALWKPKGQARKILPSPYLAKVKWLRIHPPMLSDQACRPRKAGHSAPVLWDVGGDGSEGLNIQNTSTIIQFISFQFISPPSMLKLRAFQKGLSGYVAGLPINERSMQPQLLLGTLTFLVYDDEEVSKQCSPWKGLSNSVLSFAGIASEDLDPNAWRHHESETNVQTEDVLQATHWMHSMTAHTQGILWKTMEPGSRGWLCCSLKQMLSNFISSKRWKRLSLRKRFASLRCPLRLQPAIFW